MKLLTKTSLIFITISLFVFFISGVFLYLIIKKTSDKNIDNELKTQFEHIGRSIPSLVDSTDTDLFLPFNFQIHKIDPSNRSNTSDLTIKDTILLDPYTNNYQIYRQITGFQFFGSNIYQITIFKSLIPSDELLEQLIIVFTSMTVLLILGVFFFTRNISERIWSDFFQSLDTIKKFDLAKNTKANLPPSDISEFNELNNVLNIMIARICSDFENLKEFTENITHEMQTPLAIIKSKAELILQMKNLSEEQAVILGEILNSISRLTKLNKGLVLLSQIENQQFAEINEVNFRQLIDESIDNLSFIADSKQLLVQNEVSKPIYIKMNRTLADILIGNLIKNAFVHSPEKGNVIIRFEGNVIIVSNTGLSELNDLKIFERFVKGNFKSNSLGIGLSLVRKICGKYGFSIQYSFNNKYHEFSIVFSSMNGPNNVNTYV